MRGIIRRLAIWPAIRRHVAAMVQTLPLTVPAGLAAFGTVAMCFLVAGWFKTVPVILLGLVAAIICMRYIHRSTVRQHMPGSPREQRVCGWIAAAGILLWLGANLPFTSQHLFTDRDPATYAVAGAWLVTHDDLRLPGNARFSDIPGVDATSLGFATSTVADDEIYAQGAHILPAFLGLAGRLGGYEVMLMTNLLFGAAALLALYGFARLLMKPRWALVATAAFSLSLPLLYFSRDTYTEPMALAFIFTSLSLLWHARRTGRAGLWLLAGMTLGAGLLARIDTYLPVAAVAAAFIVMLCTAAAVERRDLLRNQAIFASAIAAMGLLAWLDLSQLSSGYYRDLRPQYIAELALIAAVLVAGAVAVTLAWRTGLMERLNAATIRWRAPAITIALALFFIILASRSAWYTAYATKDGTLVRSYAEHTLVWMSWYVGPAIAALGIVGIIWGWRRLLQGKLLDLLPFLCVLAACAMYLVNPNISSDQVWASRRFLPVVLPGLTILCFLVLQRLFEQKVVTVRGIDFHPPIVAASLTTIAILGPLFVSFPFTTTRTYAPQLSQVRFICDNVPDDALVAWVGESRYTSIQPTQAFCGVPSVGIDGKADVPAALSGLAAQAKAEGRRLIIGAKAGDLATLPPGLREQLTRTNTISYADIEQTYKKFPRNRVLHERSVALGEVATDGRVVAFRADKR